MCGRPAGEQEAWGILAVTAPPLLAACRHFPVSCVGRDDLPLFLAELRGGPAAGTRLWVEREREAAWPGTSYS